jgi:hypothetical protein
VKKILGQKSVAFMKSDNENPFEATEKDWEDFFSDWDIPQGTTYPVDTDPEWLCVASQHGRISLKPSSERLVESPQKQTSPPPGYTFDR